MEFFVTVGDFTRAAKKSDQGHSEESAYYENDRYNTEDDWREDELGGLNG